MNLSSAQRRYLVFKQLIPSVLINFLINAVFGALFFRASPSVALLQSVSVHLLPNSIALDLVPTTFFLVFFTGLVVSRQIRGLRQRGKLERLRAHVPLAAFYRPHRPLSSFNAAALVTSLLVPLTVVLLYQCGIRELPLWDFIGFKALYAAGLAAVVTPLIVLLALADADADAAPLAVEPGQ